MFSCMQPIMFHNFVHMDNGFLAFTFPIPRPIWKKQMFSQISGLSLLFIYNCTFVNFVSKPIHTYSHFPKPICKKQCFQAYQTSGLSLFFFLDTTVLFINFASELIHTQMFPYTSSVETFWLENISKMTTARWSLFTSY